MGELYLDRENMEIHVLSWDGILVVVVVGDGRKKSKSENIRVWRRFLGFKLVFGKLHKSPKSLIM